MFDDFIEKRGQESGPTNIILVGVHGDERCGIVALEKFLLGLKVKRGCVLFGYGNPLAIKVNQRFTQANLNRMFKEDSLLSGKEKASYEYRRAQFLKRYLNQADALLDIHASPIPNSQPFVICEKNSQDIVKYLPINLVVSGFDQVEPGGTDYYMNKIGKIGICIECGYLGSNSSIELAEKSIWSFLISQGHIDGEGCAQRQKHIRIQDLYLTKTNDFTLAKPFFDFETLERGQIIGVDGRQAIVAPKKGVILFARNRKEIGAEAFLFGEEMENFA